METLSKMRDIPEHGKRIIYEALAAKVGRALRALRQAQGRVARRGFAQSFEAGRETGPQFWASGCGNSHLAAFGFVEAASPPLSGVLAEVLRDEDVASTTETRRSSPK